MVLKFISDVIVILHYVVIVKGRLEKLVFFLLLTFIIKKFFIWPSQDTIIFIFT